MDDEVTMKFSKTETRVLDEMVREGNWPSRSIMCRSMIRMILDDDARAHSFSQPNCESVG